MRRVVSLEGTGVQLCEERNDIWYPKESSPGAGDEMSPAGPNKARTLDVGSVALEHVRHRVWHDGGRVVLQKSDRVLNERSLK